jgi:hypothetical protein
METLDKLNELRRVSKMIEDILEEDVLARNSDYYLFSLVLEEFERIYKIPVLSTDVKDFLTNPLYAYFPCFETVRRARQKIQARRKDLASDRQVAKAKEEAEKAFILYSIE